MTLKELLDNWESESNAANDCIIEILTEFIDFMRLVRLRALKDGDSQFAQSVRERIDKWRPVLWDCEAVKEKANSDCAG